MIYVVMDSSFHELEEPVLVLQMNRYSDDIEEVLTEIFESEPLFVSNNLIKTSEDILDFTEQDIRERYNWLSRSTPDRTWDTLDDLLFGSNYTPSVYDKM